MIQLDDVSKRYGPPRRAGTVIEAVRNVSLTIARGEGCAVVGPNGAGKTTLFGLILGFLRSTGGAVEVESEDPRRYARRHGAGYLPERFTLPPEWPVRETLLAFARLERLGGDAIRLADAAIERYGLAEVANRRFGELSHGMRQRVGLAQATLADRALLVLDEPTAGLDPVGRIHLRDAATALRARGTTMLMASHDLAEVQRLADRIVVMDRGTVREVFPARVAQTPRGYTLHLASTSEHVASIFPGAVPGTSTDGAIYQIEAADTVELNHRLSALLATGALITALKPATEPIEERVRRALDARDGS